MDADAAEEGDDDEGDANSGKMGRPNRDIGDGGMTKPDSLGARLGDAIATDNVASLAGAAAAAGDTAAIGAGDGSGGDDVKKWSKLVASVETCGRGCGRG